MTERASSEMMLLGGDSGHSAWHLCLGSRRCGDADGEKLGEILYKLIHSTKSFCTPTMCQALLIKNTEGDTTEQKPLLSWCI